MSKDGRPKFTPDLSAAAPLTVEEQEREHDDHWDNERYRSLAFEIRRALYDSDAVLCSVPHGQYETYNPHGRERAEAIIAKALKRLGL